MSEANKETIKQIGRIMDIFKNSQGEIRPHFIVTGPSGSGKTFNISKLATDKEISFIEINAAQLTKEGLSGNSLSKALTPLKELQNNLVVCFVDEFDKLFISGNQNECSNDTTIGVQNEFLKVLEADTTSVFGDYGKYINISVENVLFVFAGAFNGADVDLDKLRSFGVKTEFLGRVGLLYALEKAQIDEYIDALKNSRQLELYLELFPSQKQNKDKVIQAISEQLIDAYENNTLGFRLVNTLINQYFITGGFPKKKSNKVVFNKPMVMDFEEN